MFIGTRSGHPDLTKIGFGIPNTWGKMIALSSTPKNLSDSRIELYRSEFS